MAGEPDHHFFISPQWDVIVMDWAGIWIGSPSLNPAELVVEGVQIQVLH